MPESCGPTVKCFVCMVVNLVQTDAVAAHKVVDGLVVNRLCQHEVVPDCNMSAKDKSTHRVALSQGNQNAASQQEGQVFGMLEPEVCLGLQGRSWKIKQQDVACILEDTLYRV